MNARQQKQKGKFGADPSEREGGSSVHTTPNPTISSAKARNSKRNKHLLAFRG